MNSKFSGLCFLLLVGVLSATAFQSVATAQTATAEAVAQADDAKSDTFKPDASRLGSLLRIPDSAGIYFATMNHKAVIERIFESNAYKSIKASDVAKGMKKAYRRGRSRGYEPYNADNPFAQYLKGYGDSIDSVVFQSVWQIARQVVDNELFFYADEELATIANSMNELQSKMIEQLGDIENMTEEKEEAMFQMVLDEIKSFELPTVMIGSRLDDPEGFRGLLQLAQSLAEQGMDNMPELDFVREFWQVADEEDHFLMMLEVDVSEVPWGRIANELDIPEGEKERFDAFTEALGDKTAVVAVGIIDNLLVMGVAADREELIGFGGEGKMVDLKIMKPLRKAIDENQKLISVVYMSEKYAEASLSLEDSWDQILPLISPIVNEMAEIPDDEKEDLIIRIQTEGGEFIEDFSDMFPTPGVVLGLTSLREDGVHSYARSGIKHPLMDGSKPLKLPAHAGPDTIMFVSQRLHRMGEQYDLMAKWGSKFYKYGRDYYREQIEFREELEAGVGRADDETDEEVDEEAAEEAGSDDDEETEVAVDSEPDFKTMLRYLAGMEKIAQRFDDVTKKKLMPAIEDQEAILVVDAVSGPNPWQAEMPQSNEPLPMPFPALMVETSDSKAIVEASEEYWKMIEEMEALTKKTFPAEGEDVNIIAPKRTEKDGVVSFRWTLLNEMAGIDESVQPGTMIGKRSFVMGMHEKQAAQLAAGKNSKILFGPAATDEASIAVAFYDHTAAMDMLETWFEFGLEEAKETGELPTDMAELYPAERDTLQFSEAELRDAYQRVWAMGKCFKGFSSRSYEDDDGTVSESLMKFEDIPAAK